MDQANGDNRNSDQPRSVGGVLLVAFAILGAPILWITHFNIMYFLVQPICRLGGETWFHVASVIALVGIVGSGFAAWRLGRQSSAGFLEKLDGQGGWRGFIGVYGVASAMLFVYAVLYTWSRVFTSLDVCTGL